MKRHAPGVVLFFVATFFILIQPSIARGDATASSQISFTNLAITPGGGSL